MKLNATIESALKLVKEKLLEEAFDVEKVYVFIHC